MRAGTSFKALVRRLAGLLPPPRDEALLILLRSFRDLIRGSEPNSSRADLQPPSYGLAVGPPLPKVDPLPENKAWVEPPPVQTGVVIKSLHDTGRSVRRYDLELLEKLNAEYANNPIAPRPRSYEPDAMSQAAKQRVLWAHNYIDLREKTVLEIGCGNGFEVWMLGNNFGCDAYGVDVLQLGSWDTLAGDHVHFECTDLTEYNPYQPRMFDRIISYTVWEHVLHPYALLSETYRLLKPGGLAWIRANLYAGPKASHRYRELYFPWPHLLFADDVIREWDVKHGRAPKGSSWVNRLSWLHYERYIAEIGFRLRRLSFREADWDEEFYQRFEDVLGRFPRTDLKRDFFLAVLEKPRNAAGRIAS